MSDEEQEQPRVVVSYVEKLYLSRVTTFFADGDANGASDRVDALLGAMDKQVTTGKGAATLVFFLMHFTKTTNLQVSHMDGAKALLCPADEYTRALRKYSKRYFDFLAADDGRVRATEAHPRLSLAKANAVVWLVQLGLDTTFLESLDAVCEAHTAFLADKKEKYILAHRRKKQAMRDEVEKEVIGLRAAAPVAPTKPKRRAKAAKEATGGSTSKATGGEAPRVVTKTTTTRTTTTTTTTSRSKRKPTRLTQEERRLVAARIGEIKAARKRAAAQQGGRRRKSCKQCDRQAVVVSADAEVMDE